MRGIGIVKAFISEHGLDASLGGRSRDARRVALRRDLIRKLHASGCTKAEIARVIKMDITTVRYWLLDETKIAKNRARKARHHKCKLYHWWDECAQVLEQRA